MRVQPPDTVAGIVGVVLAKKAGDKSAKGSAPLPDTGIEPWTSALLRILYYLHTKTLAIGAKDAKKKSPEGCYISGGGSSYLFYPLDRTATPKGCFDLWNE
jgi:hypothetical protein